MRYCEECFIGWPEAALVCPYCGHPVSITKAEGDAILAEAARVDTIARWAERTRAW